MLNFKSNNNDKLQLEVISFLRFPLIVGVVLMHTKLRKIDSLVATDMTAIYPFGGAYPLYENTIYFFTQVFLPIRVPLFFFFSGILFFYKIETMNQNVYLTKLKKRFRSLLIPYLVWNFLFILVYNISGILFPGSIDSYIGDGFCIKDWLLLLWNPSSYQLWFLRDLMIVVLFTPVIYWMIRKFCYLLVLLLGLLWLMSLWDNGSGFPISAFFFFSLGGYFSLSKKNFIEIVQPHTLLWGIGYFILAALTFQLRDYEWAVYLKQISVIWGCAFIIALTSYYISKSQWKVNSFLSESSFFIYAYHVMALPIIRKCLQFFIPSNTDFHATIFYFIWGLVSVVIGLLFYYILKKWIPKSLAFITGGR